MNDLIYYQNDISRSYSYPNYSHSALLSLRPMSATNAIQNYAEDNDSFERCFLDDGQYRKFNTNCEMNLVNNQNLKCVQWLLTLSNNL